MLGERSDDELLRNGASGPEWTGKDVLAHLARWHDHASDGVSAMLDGREPVSRSDYDDWNARWHVEDGALTPSEARERCERSRAALRDLVAKLDVDRWDETIHGWAAANMNGHYQEHLDEFAEVSWPD